MGSLELEPDCHAPIACHSSLEGRHRLSRATVADPSLKESKARLEGAQSNPG